MKVEVDFSQDPDGFMSEGGGGNYFVRPKDKEDLPGLQVIRPGQEVTLASVGVRIENYLDSDGKFRPDVEAITSIRQRLASLSARTE